MKRMKNVGCEINLAVEDNIFQICDEQVANSRPLLIPSILRAYFRYTPFKMIRLNAKYDVMELITGEVVVWK